MTFCLYLFVRLCLCCECTDSFLTFFFLISPVFSPIRVLECLPTGRSLSSSIWPHYGVLSPGNSRFFCRCHGDDSLMTSWLPPCSSLHYGWKILLKSLGTSPKHPPKTHSLQPRNPLCLRRVTGTNNPTMACESTAVDIHTESIVFGTHKRVGGGATVLLTNL